MLQVFHFANSSLYGKSCVEGKLNRSLMLHDRTVPDEIFNPVQQFPDASPDMVDMERIIRPAEIQRTAECMNALFIIPVCLRQ